jgi:hypothetical protein
MTDPTNLLNLFERSPYSVALGELIAAARDMDDHAIETDLLGELNDAIADVRHLGRCLALEAS